MASERNDAGEARPGAAQRKLADCDQRLARYRTALDAGADATVVAGWMAGVQGERLRAERELADAQPTEKLTKAQIARLVLQLRDIASVLSTADPKLKAEVYAELGVNITYDQDNRLVIVEAGPCTTERVGEPSSSLCEWRLQPWGHSARASQGRPKGARRGSLDGPGHLGGDNGSEPALPAPGGPLPHL